MQTNRSRKIIGALLATFVVASVVAVPTLASAEPGVSAVQVMPGIPGSSVPPDATYGAVSCPSTTSCTAAGPWGHVTGEGRPTVVTETNGTWGVAHAIALPAGGTIGTGDPAQLDSVSCSAVGDCLAVGGYPTSSTTKTRLPLIVEESSGTWGASRTLARPANALSGSSEFAGIDAAWCTSPGNCIALGFFRATDKAIHVMAATETSSVWSTPTQLPDIPGVSASSAVTPVSLSCADLSDCTMVGYGIDLSTGLAFTDFAWTETAGTWASPSRIPVAAKQLFLVNSVACPDTTTCFAVGIGGSIVDSTAAIATETSGTWGAPRNLGPPRLSPLTRGGALLGISCSTMTCEAVGSVMLAKDPNIGLAMAMTWANGVWSSMTLVHGVRAGSVAATQPSFVGVSCASSTQCLGVGGGGLYPYKSANEPVYPFSAAISPVRSVVAPGPPISVLARPRLRGALVTWQPPYVDGGAPITTFTATAMPGGRSCTTAGYGCAIAGLVNGRRYRVRVTDANSFSPSRAALSERFAAGAAPSTPTHVKVVPAGSVATVSWHPSNAPAGEPITRYVVRAVAPGQLRECVTKSHTCVMHELIKGDRYTFSVSAIDATGASRLASVRIVET